MTSLKKNNEVIFFIMKYLWERHSGMTKWQFANMCDWTRLSSLHFFPPAFMSTMGNLMLRQDSAMLSKYVHDCHGITGWTNNVFAIPAIRHTCKILCMSCESLWKGPWLLEQWWLPRTFTSRNKWKFFWLYVWL